MGEERPWRTRHDGWNDDKRRRFMETLALTGCVRDAARVAGISSNSAYRRRGRDARFRAEWNEALGRAATSLEATAYKRAVEGVEEPILHGGEIVGTKRRYSDSLLRLLLQASNPDKFGRMAPGGSVSAASRFKTHEEIAEEAYKRGRSELTAELELDVKERRRLLEEKLSEMNRRMGGNG
jgi:hypothetical protein